MKPNIHLSVVVPVFKEVGNVRPLAEVPVFNGMHRFLPTLPRGQGFSVIEHAVNHRERLRGVSKYGVGNRLWRGIRDCLEVRWYLKRAVPGDRIAGNE